MTITRIFVLLSIFSAWPVLSSEEPRLNVAVIAYSQETCTFCPGGDSEIKDRTWRVPYVPGHLLTARREGFVGGFWPAPRGIVAAAWGVTCGGRTLAKANKIKWILKRTDVVGVTPWPLSQCSLGSPTSTPAHHSTLPIRTFMRPKP